MRRRHLGWVLLASVAAAPAMAAETASAFIARIGREIPGVIKGATTVEERRARIGPFLARVVDLDQVSRFCLGRYWRQATPAQRTEYQSLFIGSLTAAVANRVGAYAPDTRITVLPESASPDGMQVRTVIQNGAQPPVHITWLVETSSEPYRIIDVVAEGISLRLSQRSDYMSYLDRHGGDIDGFLRVLRQHVGV